MYSRRRVLRVAPAAAAVALAGCSGGGSGAAGIGESQTMNDLTLTLESMERYQELTVVADESSDQGGGNGGTTTGETTGETTSGTTSGGGLQTTVREGQSGQQWVVVGMSIENETDSEKTLPSPGQVNAPLADGKLYLTGLGQGISLTTFSGDLYLDGERWDSLTEVVAEADWTLPPGETVSGWILFEIDEEADLGKVSVTGTSGGEQVRWELRQP